MSVLVVEANDLEAEILEQILGGFKVRGVTRFRTTHDLQDHLGRDAAELVIVGAAAPVAGAADGYDFIRWARRHKVEAIRTAAVILLAGHTLQGNVVRARDCGASFVIAKPITPRILYERMMWLAKDARGFIETKGYAGPDRRFQKIAPPFGMAGRRRDDFLPHLGEAKAPNPTQAEIDAMFSAKGATWL